MRTRSTWCSAVPEAAGGRAESAPQRVLRLLRRHRVRDLAIHALLESVSGIDRLYSTLVLRLKAALVGVEVGPGATVWGKVMLRRFPGSRITVGRNVRIVSRAYRYMQNVYPQSKLRTMSPGASITIGDDVGFNSISIYARSQRIEIGDGCLIGGNCQISDTDGHPLWPPESRTHYPGTEHDAPVTLGRRVFVGLNVIILKGVQIGDNSIIAAGSVVTRSIPANCVAGGVPARVLRHLTLDARGP